MASLPPEAPLVELTVALSSAVSAAKERVDARLAIARAVLDLGHVVGLGSVLPLGRHLRTLSALKHFRWVLLVTLQGGVPCAQALSWCATACVCAATPCRAGRISWRALRTSGT